jgi:hypothetical protein
VTGIAQGDFAETDAAVASIRIFLAVDGCGSYVNSSGDHAEPTYEHFVADVAEWALGLKPGSLGFRPPGSG